MDRTAFVQAINQSYSLKTPSIYLGGGVYKGEIIGEAKVNLLLRMMTRHGLVTGATGSGKTRTARNRKRRFRNVVWNHDAPPASAQKKYFLGRRYSS